MQGGETPDTERVRIFVAFEKQESAVKGELGRNGRKEGAAALSLRLPLTACLWQPTNSLSGLLAIVTIISVTEEQVSWLHNLHTVVDPGVFHLACPSSFFHRSAYPRRQFAIYVTGTQAHSIISMVAASGYLDAGGTCTLPCSSSPLPPPPMSAPTPTHGPRTPPYL